MPTEESSFQVLSTKRLVLRKPEPNDAREIFNLRSNEQVNRYLDRVPAGNLDDASNFLNKIVGGIKNNEHIYYWAICLKENPRLIGTICLFDFSPDKQSAEIGYELLPFYQGKGIMQEAISIVIYYGFQVMQLSTITAFPSVDNLSSIRILERNGFKKDEDELDRKGKFVRYLLER